MIEQGYGRIINVSSGIATAPGASPGLNAYATAKAGLEAHTLGLAAELAGPGATVKIVRPGPAGLQQVQLFPSRLPVPAP
jgi:NAD(P)-dependent dehydrogenase (short-subunit alcohol dehydrogenase family)